MNTFSDFTITQTPVERIVDAINEISVVCGDEIRVVLVESNGPPITVVISDANLFNDIVSLGETLSQLN